MMDGLGRQLIERLNGLWVEEGQTFGLGGHLLTVFPLRGARQGALDYVLLDEALAADLIDVRELDQPQVNALQVINRGDRPVLIIDGETLVGGQQNRVVNSTILVPPGRTVLPVSCVERGRWNDNPHGFAASDIAYPALRQAKVTQVATALELHGQHAADQGQIWEGIAGRQSAAAVSSPTEALRDLYERDRARLVAYVRALPYPRDAVGLIVGYTGRIVSLELVDNPDTLLRLWPRLIRAAALDALAHKPDVAISHKRAVKMLHRPQHAAIVAFPSPGLGEDLRVAGNGVSGAGVSWNGSVLHTALFRVPTHG